MRRSLFLIFAVVFVFSCMGFATVCSDFNAQFPQPAQTASDQTAHVYGNHYYQASQLGTCNYTPGTATNTCYTHATAISTFLGDGESGLLVNPVYSHYIGYNSKNGASDSNGGASNADTQAAFAVRSCLVGSGCGVTVGIVGTGTGTRYTVSVPPDSIWSATQQYYAVNCVAEKTGSGNGNACGSCGGDSPIIIDTKGNGFHFTDPKNGCVRTALVTGTPQCYSWPKQNSGNAWLVLDDGVGPVTLFGNHSPHANGDYLPGVKPTIATGIYALAFYDQPSEGGNQDAILDARDAVWPKLKLWIDMHCEQLPGTLCFPLSQELHSPEEFGITAIGLYSMQTDLHDEWGNWFRFYAQANPDPNKLQFPKHPNHEMRVSDVWLVGN